MTTTFQTNLTNETYNGWTNWETWNVALWIGNDEYLYREARKCYSYPNFVERMGFASSATPDGAKYDSPELDIDELNEMIEEL
jgi:hypothetical protein